MTRRAQRSAHALVGDTSIEKRFTLWNEAMPQVERQRRYLRFEDHLMHALLFRERDQFVQQSRSDTAPAPPSQHCHASDVTVGEQPPGADRFALLVFSQDVQAVVVDTIPFELERHALFVDEYVFADSSKLRLILPPIGAPDTKRGDHALDYRHAGVDPAALEGRIAQLRIPETETLHPV